MPLALGKTKGGSNIVKFLSGCAQDYDRIIITPTRRAEKVTYTVNLYAYLIQEDDTEQLTLLPPVSHSQSIIVVFFHSLLTP